MIVSVILLICHIASNAYCRDIKAQKQEVLSKAIQTALEIKPIPAYQIGEISAYLRGALREQSGTSGKAGGLKDLNRSKRLDELRRS
jgi:hypothetical protein